MRVLIVGAGGYIGEEFARYAARRFSVEIVDSFDGWARKDFEGFDSVIFAAGIAHRRQTKENAALYFTVNRDLAVAVAKKAKISKVPQFIYLSSMAVFGKKEGEISSHTKANPRHNDSYGTSKHSAEETLKNLQNKHFKLAIIRPPMVYGPNCPGKYGRLKKIAKFMPIIPCNQNKRSVIYISNLCEFLCKTIESRDTGVFHPGEINSTARLIEEIRRQNGKKSKIVHCGWLLKLLMAVFPPIRTAYSSLYYKE